jgi:PERQ amino acid-rich with GYF domain-containing protein
MTFRRTSTTPLGQTSQTAPPAEPADESHAPSFEPSPSRYTKDDLLDMFSGRKADDPSRLFISGWDPSLINGSSGRGWGKSNENHVPQEPGACWDQNGDGAPLGLQELSSEEVEVSSSPGENIFSIGINTNGLLSRLFPPRSIPR